MKQLDNRRRTRQKLMVSGDSCLLTEKNVVRTEKYEKYFFQLQATLQSYSTLVLLTVGRNLIIIDVYNLTSHIYT